MDQSKQSYQITFALKLIVATLGFSCLLAVKDLLFRSLAMKGMSSGQLLFLVGLGCGVVTSCVAVFTGSSLRLKNQRLQLLRFVVAGLSGYLIAEAFHILNASAVAMVSKVYIPLLLIVSPLIGVSYTIKQKSLALASIVAIGVFAFYVHSSGQSLLGFVYAVAAAIFVMVEYITLRKTTLTENPFWIAFTPAISCFTFGLLKAGAGGIQQIGLLPVSHIGLGLFSGFVLYLIYFISIYRYRLLPIGISEYPSLITALVLVPLEFVFFGWRPDLAYVSCLTVTTVLMGFTIYFRDHRPVLSQVAA